MTDKKAIHLFIIGQLTENELREILKKNAKKTIDNQTEIV